MYRNICNQNITELQIFKSQKTEDCVCLANTNGVIKPLADFSLIIIVWRKNSAARIRMIENFLLLLKELLMAAVLPHYTAMR